MAVIIPLFEQILEGSGTVQTETWINLSGIIPANQQLWLGYATFISSDKTLTFELRPNTVGQSTGTISTTQLRSFAAVPSGDSKDVDLFFYGNISTLAPQTGPSTGVESLWLRVKSNTAVVGAFDYIVYYTVY